MKHLQNHKVKFKSLLYFYISFHYSKIYIFSKMAVLKYGKLSWFSQHKGGG